MAIAIDDEGNLLPVLSMDWVLRQSGEIGITIGNSKGESVTVNLLETRSENNHLAAILLQLWQMYDIKIDGSYDYGFDYRTDFKADYR